MIEPIKAMVRRIIPDYRHYFSFEIATFDKDTFEIHNGDKGHIIIRGNNGISLASGLYYYLKNFCNFHLSWCGDSPQIHKPLPPISNAIKITNPHKFRVYFNYCTFNYSATWWDWDRWEKEIDFMALNGFNMPLNIVGTEKVWYDTLIEYEFTDEEARTFLVGPCYLAWQLMTNIQSHGGPLPLSWINMRLELGKKIFKRQKELGMIPIQHGFSGYVPKKLKDKYPQANINQEKKWCGFEGTYQLDPLDPLFPKIGRSYLSNLFKYFGKTHFLAMDPFHEGKPPKSGRRYLKAVGKAIFNLMDEMDPQSTWVMQAWSIKKSIAKSVPKDRLLILDLDSSKWRYKRKFWNYDFIGGKLHNFGARINLHGDLENLAKNPYMKIKKKAKNNKGMGLFMEGITQNPVFYDLSMDLIWREKGVDLENWIGRYITRRYGKSTPELKQAWKYLIKGPYKKGTDNVEFSSQVAARPALNVKKSGPNHKLKIPYDPSFLYRSWKLFLIPAGSDSDFTKSSGFKFDLVDIARQTLSNHLQLFYPKIRDAFHEGDLSLFKTLTQHYLDILLDMDRLLNTRKEYNFSTWLKSAHAHATCENEKKLYEFNAKMLFTIWGPLSEPQIFDYAWKEWAGLIKDFYYVRWEKYFLFLEDILQKNSCYSETGLDKVYGREAFRANDFYEKLAQWEISWVKKPYKSVEGLKRNEKESKDEISIAKCLFKKYKDNLQEEF